ncbi:MAG: PhzF family phenazine biosynthesis protein [Chthoniobacterales bacterium]
MRRLNYHLVDVFTDRAFGGNPLAVFTEGEGIPDAIMQSIAKELNLSETTFVLPPRNPENDFQVRIFTPASELPMAGHPTIGTAFVLAREGMVKPLDRDTTIVFEEGVGPIPVSITWRDRAPGFIEMRQPLPQFGAIFSDADATAEMLSIDARDIREANLPIQVVSCGVPYLFVPVSTVAAMNRIRFRLDLWEKRLRGAPAEDVFVFSRETQFPGSDVHSRMFAPAFGISEDPATGSASGPLGCYLVRHEVIPSDGELRCVSEQGIEIGRPSFIKIRIAHRAHEITEVRVGGTCHYMGAGTLELDEDSTAP